ncbi:TPA: restriction endonuclease subunit S [Campylobacter coli]|nr:restriction endonuclease subunit S [Campylobacter coli]HEB9318998.1 restriction endonuclease subunit S [Campylobacter coli]
MYNQTLQEKYPHLEISVLKLSEVQKDNESKRIDSEYFKKEYLENEAIIKIKDNYAFLENFIVKMTGGATPLGADYPDKGIPFLRVQNIMQNYFNVEDIVYISQQDDEYLKRSRLKFNDVLLTITGISYGKSAVVERDLIGANINQHSVKIEVKNINPYFLSTFLNSKFGKLQSDKKITGVTRPALDYQSIKKFLIPIFPMEFQLEIQNLVKDSHKVLEESKELYKKAEEILYNELGLDPKTPLQSLLNSKTNNSTNSPNISIRTLKESFLKTGRLDSEYYQSKYEDIENFIKSYSNGYDSFLNIINNKDTNFTPKNNENYNYIELANIGNNGNINEPISDLGKNLPTRARRIVSNGDVIISSIEGSLSSCALITQEFDKHLVSTGFFVLNSKLLNSETLLVMFKSQIFQEYLKKFPSGTILCAINKEELSKIFIPKIDPITQEKIAKYIQESFNLRKKSKQLLDNAKIKVEEQIQGKV